MVNTETVLVVSVQKAIALKVCDDPATAKHTDYRFLSFLTESIVKLLTTILRLLVRVTRNSNPPPSLYLPNTFFGNSCATKGMVNTFWSTLELM